MGKDVKIYTFSTCPFCTKAKGLLDKENIEYEEIEISGSAEALSKLEEFTGSDTVPQIFVGENFIGGCDEIIDLYNRENFDEIFGK